MMCINSLIVLKGKAIKRQSALSTAFECVSVVFYHYLGTSLVNFYLNLR